MPFVCRTKRVLYRIKKACKKNAHPLIFQHQKKKQQKSRKPVSLNKQMLDVEASDF